jgi:CRP/FNR family transcriptional regulator, cyclic AMP receptor protein
LREPIAGGRPSGGMLDASVPGTPVMIEPDGAPSAWRREATPARPGTAALLDLDPDLAAGLSGERVATARSELRARVVRLRRGEWAAGKLASSSAHNIGLLVVDGVIAREVVINDMVSTELLGAGDLIRPWSRDGEPRLLEQQVRWQILADTRVALLDRAFASAVARFPEINCVLIDRLSVRAQRLATVQAISHLNAVDRRLLALFWHFAERWGRVAHEGIVVPLTLSHRLLGEIVGASRPSVTTAVGMLEREGRLLRRSDATWLLIGEPPRTATQAASRVVSHRRRLIPGEPPPTTASR